MDAENQVIQYFETVDGYGAPLVPKSQIQESEIGTRKTYYKVSYDEGRRITRITKMLKGHMSIQFDYEYGGNGRVSSTKVTRPDGTIEVIPATAVRQPAHN